MLSFGGDGTARMMSMLFLLMALIPAVFIADAFIEGEVQAKGGFLPPR